jgi:hypothetical protein
MVLLELQIFSKYDMMVDKLKINIFTFEDKFKFQIYLEIKIQETNPI